MWSTSFSIQSFLLVSPPFENRAVVSAMIILPIVLILLVAGGIALLLWRYPSLRPDRLFKSGRLHLPPLLPFNPAEWLKDRQLRQTLQATGFMYDPTQDIFYSDTGAWQRNYGYCRMYDEASAPLGMVIDCEPVCFKYGNKNWLIEFWKGQYDLTCGAEIGVFTNDGSDPNDSSFYHGAFFQSASAADELDLAFTLYRKGKKLFTRQSHHWWLTGFVLGLFSEPDQLTMDISVTLKDRAMYIAFVRALRAVGYTRNDYTVQGTTVSFTFARPHSPQPLTRTPALEWVIQRKNELLCDMYDDVTEGYDSMPAKLKALKRQSPDLYSKAVNIRRSKQLAGIYRKY